VDGTAFDLDGPLGVGHRQRLSNPGLISALRLHGSMLKPLMPEVPLLEVARIDVQWADVDRMQHVNNVVFFRWFETARTNYFDRLDFSANAGAEVFPILVQISCDFRAQVRQPDVVHVSYATTKLGRSSVGHVYQITSEQQQAVVAEGSGTWICFDYRNQRPLPIPETLLNAMERIEARRLGAQQ
jgi:acyl-CoA thioester hydrolase